MQNWVDMYHKCAGVILDIFPNPQNMVDRIGQIIYRHLEEIDVQYMTWYIEIFGVSEEYKEHLSRGGYHNNTDMIAMFFIEPEYPNHLSWMHRFIKDVQYFEFNEMSVYNYHIPLNEQLGNVTTPYGLTTMAKTEVAWAFYIVYMVANFVIPMSKEL